MSGYLIETDWIIDIFNGQQQRLIAATALHFGLTLVKGLLQFPHSEGNIYWF